MILYIIKSTLCLAILLIVYKLFFEKEKMHHFNRGYLLLALLFSLIIPLLPVGIGDLSFRSSPMSSKAETIQQASSMETVNMANNLDTGNNVFLVASIMLYGLVSSILFLRLIYKIDLILSKVRYQTRFMYGKATVVLLKKKTIPFSFFSYIFLNEVDYKQGKISQEVFIHEHAHVRQKHSFDILFIEVMKCLLWFNPLLYYFKHALQLNHEFLADQTVINKTDCVKSYQELLLQTIRTKSQSYQLASNFNFSLMKKRLLMMNQSSPRSRPIIKQLSVIPVIFALLFLFGANKIIPEQDNSLKIEIFDSEVIELNGKEVHLSDFGEILKSIPDKSNFIISLRVHPDAFFGVVMDVQQILRQQKVLQINYATMRNNQEKTRNVQLPPAPIKEK